LFWKILFFRVFNKKEVSQKTGSNTKCHYCQGVEAKWEWDLSLKSIVLFKIIKIKSRNNPIVKIKAQILKKSGLIN